MFLPSLVSLFSRDASDPEATPDSTARFAYLPSELLVEIFSYLDYITLHKTVRPLCRRFNDIVVSVPVKLAGSLFRTEASSARRKPPRKKVLWHPALEALCVDLATQTYRDITLRDVRVADPRKRRAPRLEETFIAEENACWPGVAKLHATYSTKGKVHSIIRSPDDKSCVTVGDVAAALVRGLNRWSETRMKPCQYHQIEGCSCQQFAFFMTMLAADLQGGRGSDKVVFLVGKENFKLHQPCEREKTKKKKKAKSVGSGASDANVD